MYGRFISESGDEFGSFEVFHNDGKTLTDDEGAALDAGWYWYACFPGCMPEGDPQGPYKTAQEAYNAAREQD